MDVKCTATVFVNNELPKDNKPEIAFAGKSNVGKSSLINILVSRKKMAYVSRTPGKTRTINFFLIDNKFYFVDLPGYGFASVSSWLKKGWKELIEFYIVNSVNLKLVILILDIRRTPNEDDFLMKQWLENFGITYLVVVTKVDKVSYNERLKHLQEIKKKMEFSDSVDVIPFSSKTGEGKNELWGKVLKYK